LQERVAGREKAFPLRIGEGIVSFFKYPTFRKKEQNKEDTGAKKAYVISYFG
jgi:hypothetical protein